MRGFGEAVERGGHHLRRVPVGRAGVEAEQSGVDEIPVEAEDRIGEAAFLPHLLEEPRRHAAARRGGEDLRGVVIRRAGRPALEPDHDMGLLEAPAELGLATAIDGRRFGRRGRGMQLFEPGLREIDDVIVFDRAGGRDHGGAGAVSPAEIAIDRVPVEGADALARAEDRAPDRLVRPGGRGEEIEHPVVGRILDRADLLDDDILLPLELGGVERRFR